MKLALLLILLTISVSKIVAQPSFGIASGISIDVNNKGRFKQVPLSLQFSVWPTKVGSFIIKADLGIPLITTESDIAYTSNTSLPEHIFLDKKIKTPWFTTAFGYRFNIFKPKEVNTLFLDFFPTGLSWQSFSVDYGTYDKNNYEVLNPDTGLKTISLISAIGIGYLHKIYKSGMLSFQIHAQTPLFASVGKYKQSFKYNAPLQITAGYFFTFKKNSK